MRRFYVFNDLATLKGHIAQVKTVPDMFQLASDIKAANCNLTRFKIGNPGIWGVDHATETGWRHLFLTPVAIAHYGTPTSDECDSYTILED